MKRIIVMVVSSVIASVLPILMPIRERLTFYTFFWLVWFAMLLIGDPIASWLGSRDHVGDRYTDTHLIVTVLNPGLRAAVLGWLIWHFLVAHKAS